MRIFLIGYMGSGKSTIGKLLAIALSLPFYDTDDLLETRTGLSISQIFKEHGEAYFRDLETEILKDIKASIPRGVFATGGGMPVFNKNIELINRMGISIYLWCGIDVIVDRIYLSENRPLVAGKSKSEVKKTVKKSLGSRVQYYLKAHYKVLSSRPSGAVVSSIINKLKKDA